MASVPNSKTVDEDITMNFSIDVVENPMDDINDMVRLSEFGCFSEAITVFRDSLAKYSNVFPIFAEYLRLLFDQGDFNTLRDAENQNTAKHTRADRTALTWTSNEIDAVNLMHQYGNAQYYQNSKEILKAISISTRHIAERLWKVRLAALTGEQV
jgi:hypothetical protein